LARMIRSTVQRATGMPWRCRCAHIFEAAVQPSATGLERRAGMHRFLFVCSGGLIFWANGPQMCFRCDGA
jgi:hypothetical protein